MNRRTLFKYLGVAALAGVTEALHAAAPFLRETSSRAEASATILPCQAFREVEELTQKHLLEIEKRLEKLLAEKEEFSEDDLRMLLIRFCMWGPMAEFTQWALGSLGDNPGLLEELPLLMRFTRWMSEPYIFPVETPAPEHKRKNEMAKVTGFMASRQKEGLKVSLDNVGDASHSEAEARAYRSYYLNLIEHFNKEPETRELYLSLKLSALVHDLDATLGNGKRGNAKRAEIKGALGALLRAASGEPEGKHVFIRLDMEEYAYKNLTLDLFREVVRENPTEARAGLDNLRLGVVIQAYLRDSGRDLAALAELGRGLGVRIPVRLVKGAYLAHERKQAQARNHKSPVWNHKSSTDANYELLSAYLLLSRDALDPAFATHNIRSQSRVAALAQALGLGQRECEFQMLYGMGDPIKTVVTDLGHELREYVPAGNLARGLKYAGRRFSELASGDNALARTMRGDFTSVNRELPAFTGEEDIDDSASTVNMVSEAAARKGLKFTPLPKGT